METIILSVLFISLSLDGFVIMMKKGATMAKISLKNLLLFASTFSFFHVGAVTIGFLFAIALKMSIFSFLNKVVSILILFGIGIIYITKGIKIGDFKESLDSSFNFKGCVKLACLTNFDAFFLGMALSLVGYNILSQNILAFIVSFVSTIAGLMVGYYQGLRWQRTIEVMAGSVLMVFSLVMAWQLLRVV